MKTRNTTSWVVTGLGAAVTTVGVTAFSGPIAAGIAGFGAAHVVLGVLDMYRPTIKNR
ncbi:hypothetical protein MFMK1_001459 [Metallumcola ferriviriculae]|uniref:Secreted protein n=1 Tax=Metallumcola ferriviriculae TaxID=3039180 RepID=A0AAU0UP83_9FIRM|nr:hypothetical protein MFMK1_001459 [Desulfitibacteraceae bacterium MK1]